MNDTRHDHDHDDPHDHDHDHSSRRHGADDAHRPADRPGDATGDGGSAASGAARPLGFWLATVERRITAEVEAALADLEVTRRDWRRLNLIAGDVRDERMLARLDARPHKLDDLVERGWVAGGPGDWSVTTAGRDALDELTRRVGAVRDRVAGAVASEDFATMLASLEAIARELGWDESSASEHERRRRGGPGTARAHRGRTAGRGHRHDRDVHVRVHVHHGRRRGHGR
ncbi:hypothetical protein [Agromyces sp. SYSU T0242]|uniref:hypothetical protein n=1 Tax=Agromyces litoreus TaxID=3158561 RepID=UPI00339A10EF